MSKTNEPKPSGNNKPNAMTFETFKNLLGANAQCVNRALKALEDDETLTEGQIAAMALIQKNSNAYSTLLASAVKVAELHVRLGKTPTLLLGIGE